MDKHYITGPDSPCVVLVRRRRRRRRRIEVTTGVTLSPVMEPSDVIPGVRNASITQTHAAAAAVSAPVVHTINTYIVYALRYGRARAPDLYQSTYYEK